MYEKKLENQQTLQATFVLVVVVVVVDVPSFALVDPLFEVALFALVDHSLVEFEFAAVVVVVDAADAAAVSDAAGAAIVFADTAPFAAIFYAAACPWQPPSPATGNLVHEQQKNAWKT